MSHINLYISMYNDVRLPKRLLYGELGDSGQHKRCKVKVSLRSFSIDPIDCETTAVNRGEWRDRIPNGAQPSTKRQILAAAEESRQFTDYGLSFRAASALFHYRGHTALWGSVIDAVIIFCGMCVFSVLKTHASPHFVSSLFFSNLLDDFLTLTFYIARQFLSTRSAPATRHYSAQSWRLHWKTKTLY